MVGAAGGAVGGGPIPIAVTFGFELDDDTESGIAGIAIALGGAAILTFGLWDRTQRRMRGDVAIVVLVGLLITEIRDPRSARVI